MAVYVNVHTHGQEGIDIELFNRAIIKEFQSGCCSFGLHPWDIEKTDEGEMFEMLKALCIERKIVAVGEIGLDRAISTPLEIQKKIFRTQLEIAEQFELPVILHSVRSNSDLLQIKKERKSTIPWVFHGFRGSLEEANQLIDKQCFLSFGISILHHAKSQEVLRNCELSNVFFETDDSDEKIMTIYEKAAEILDICIPDLKTKIYSNFLNVFGEKCKKIG